MKILLFGKDGQVGWELQRSLAPLGELIALDRHSPDLCGDFTNHVLAQAQRAQPAIKIVAKAVGSDPTSAFPTPARRPHNSRLDTIKLQATFGLTLPPWQPGVDRMLDEISTKLASVDAIIDA